MLKDIRLSVGNLHWLGDDSTEDLCAHGSVELTLDGFNISDHSDACWTVSATALHLLRTLKKDHTNVNRVCDFLITCCGNGMYESFKDSDVDIIECGYGIDFQVIHSEKVLTLNYHSSEVGHKIEVNLSQVEWEQVVFSFADTVQEFYQISPPKKTNDDDSGGYIAFWKEWNRRRNV